VKVYDVSQLLAAKTALRRAGRGIGEKLLAHFAKAAAKGDISAKPKAAKPGTDLQKRKIIFAAPFDNETGQEQYDPAAAGLGDMIAVLLAEQEHIRVVERQRLDELGDEQARTLKGLTGSKYAVAAGRLLYADTVLTGRLFLLGNKLTANIKAIELSTQRIVATDEISCRPVYLMEAALQVARKLAKQMALPLPEIDLKEVDKSPIATLHFAKAVSLHYAGDMDGAIMQFMRTVDLDPDYHEAHYWAGLCYFKMKEYAHAIIEMRDFLKGAPKSKRAEHAKRLLAEAEKLEGSRGATKLDLPGKTSPKEKAK
jgi:tetratricopeptide (TPR) repeat protein